MSQVSKPGVQPGKFFGSSVWQNPCRHRLSGPHLCRSDTCVSHWPHCLQVVPIWYRKCILIISGAQFQRPFPRLCRALHPVHVSGSTIHVGKVFWPYPTHCHHPTDHYQVRRLNIKLVIHVTWGHWKLKIPNCWENYGPCTCRHCRQGFLNDELGSENEK